MGITEDDLKKECRYCYREIDNSGLEGFRCTNKTVIKTKGTTWCLPKCADQPCSTCTYREIKDDNECLFYETCSSRTAICKIRQPDNGCPVYRYFKGLIVKDYEARLKADLKAILVELQVEIKEMDSGCGWEGYRPTAQVLEVIQQKINELPSVTPIRPKGRWIDKQHLCGYCSAECSSCHKRSNGYVHDNGFSLEYKYYDFCPNCGAKMVEPQESEET